MYLLLKGMFNLTDSLETQVVSETMCLVEPCLLAPGPSSPPVPDPQPVSPALGFPKQHPWAPLSELPHPWISAQIIAPPRLRSQQLSKYQGDMCTNV